MYVRYLVGRTSWGRIPLASTLGGPPLLGMGEMGTNSTSTATSIADDEASRSRLALLSFHRTTSCASEVLWCTIGAYLKSKYVHNHNGTV